MKTIGLVGMCALLAATPASADRDKKYSLADLKALVKDRSFKEAIEHLGDVAPSERTAEWQDVAGQAAIGFVGTGKDAITKVAMMIQIEQEYPPVLKQTKYLALRTDEGPKGFDACFKASDEVDECLGYATKFVDDDAGNAKLALAIAKIARRNMFAYGAVPLFKRAVAADKAHAACKDDDLALAVIAALGLPADQDNAAIGRELAKTCWSVLRKPIVDELGKNDSSYTKANACTVLKAQKDRDAARLCAEDK